MNVEKWTGVEKSGIAQSYATVCQNSHEKE